MRLIIQLVPLRIDLYSSSVQNRLMFLKIFFPLLYILFYMEKIFGDFYANELLIAFGSTMLLPASVIVQASEEEEESFNIDER